MMVAHTMRFHLPPLPKTPDGSALKAFFRQGCISCISLVIFILLACMSAVYLFFVPALYARTGGYGTRWDLLFAVFLYAQLWLLGAIQALDAVAKLYGYRGNFLRRLFQTRDVAQREIAEISAAKTLFLCFSS